MSTKICTKCSVEKPLSEYHNNKQYKNSHCKTCVKEYRKLNPQLEKKHRREWLDNGGRISRKEYNRKYQNNLTPIQKIKRSIRSRLSISVKLNGYSKSSTLNKAIGCDWNTLKQHLETQFDDKMNWDNYGSYWEVDHIKPMVSAKTVNEVYELNHYTNLQPLYWEENRQKSDKLNWKANNKNKANNNLSK